MLSELSDYQIMMELLHTSSSGFMIFCIDSTDSNRYVCHYANKSAHDYTNIQNLEGLSRSEIFSQVYQLPNQIDVDSKKYLRFKNASYKCHIDWSEKTNKVILCTITAVSISDDMIDHFSQLWVDAEEIMQFGAWVWNITSQKMIWSQGLYHLLGYSPSELKEEDISFELFKSHVHPCDLGKFKDEAEKVFTYLKSYVLEFRVVSTKGAEMYIYLRGNNYIDEITGDRFSCGTIFNVSSIKVIQNELETKVRDLNQSNIDLEQFAYIASHDLQEPLRKIVSFGDRLLTKGKENMTDQQLEYLHKILGATSRMQKMISDLLDFSLITSNEKPFVDTDLHEILSNVLTDLEVTIHQKNAIVDFEYLPKIQAVPFQIFQLFLNLISNALKFTHKDRLPIIQITCHELKLSEYSEYGFSVVNRYIKIEFKDNGIGFENSNSKKMFELFQRLRGRNEFSGSGIGLAICKKVADRHRGSIQAFGQPNVGSIFRLVLPLKQII